MRTPLVIVASAVTILAMTGCSLLPDASPTATPSQTPSASSEPSASPSPSATPESPSSRPVPPCDTLVSPQAMYDYNSNIAADSGFSPAAGSLVARVAQSGVACGWTNLSSSEVIAIAVGSPDTAAAAGFAAEFDGWTPQRWSGIDGYFTTVNGTGQAAVISDGYVVVAVSTAFYEAADAEPLVEAALDAL